MILPTKHENINFNPLVIGADILFELRKSDLTLDDLYQKIRLSKDIELDTFYDTITFLWLIESISYNKTKISSILNVSK